MATALVFMMHAGFAMVETGFTRAKNAGNIIMKNFMTFCGGSISYIFIGFGIMFGLSAFGFVGTGTYSLGGDWSHLGLGIPNYVFLIFQAVFAATAATIVSGAVAERIKYSSYLIYSIVLTALIYPVVGHWVWGGGWLGEMGFVDFAGSTVVHFVGGCSALVGAYFVGPRVGKYNEDGSANAIPGHNVTLGALGVFILWFGWFGFNGGSTLSGSDPDLGHNHREYKRCCFSCSCPDDADNVG
jgi:ammonium transporter, Amt family